MADQFWTGATSSAWLTATNWASTSGGSDDTGPPGASDDVIFDANGDVDCNHTSGAPTIHLTLTVNSGYTQTATFTRSPSWIGVDLSGAVAVPSNSFVPGAGGIVIRSGGSLIVDGVFDAGGADLISILSGGTLTNNGVSNFKNAPSGTATLTVVSGGTLNGTGSIAFHRDNVNLSGVIGNDLIGLDFLGGQTLTLTGATTFGGDATFSDADLIFDVNGQALTLLGSFSHAGTWAAGITGTILVSGSANQTLDFNGELIDAFEVDKTGGVVQLTGALSPVSFTGIDTGTGDFDPNGQTITTTGNCSWAATFTFEAGSDTMDGSDWQIGGNFTADGQTLPADSGWDLDVTGTAVASGTGDVGWCTAGGTEIDASAGPWTEVEDNNVNWNFGAAGTTIEATTGAIVTTGLSATINAGTTINATLGTVVLASLNAEVDAGTTINAVTGAVTFNGLNPSVDASTIISPTVGALVIAGLNATIVVDITMTVTTGAISIAGLSASISTGLNVVPPVILSSGIYGTTL